MSQGEEFEEDVTGEEGDFLEEDEAGEGEGEIIAEYDVNPEGMQGDTDSEMADDQGDVNMQDDGEEDSEPLDDSLQTFQGHSDSVYCVSVNPTNPDIAVSGGGDDKACIWNLRTAEKLGEIVHKESVVSVAFSADGKLVASGALDGSVLVHEVETGKLIKSLDGPGEAIEWVAWHSKGNILLAGSTDQCAYMWAASAGTLMGIFAGHGGSVTCGAFTPDGKKVVTASGDASVKVWNPKDQSQIYTYSGHNWHEQSISCMVIKADGSMFASGSEDFVVCVGNINTGKPLVRLRGHNASVECVAFGPNYLYSGAIDGTLKVWDISSAQARLTCTHDSGSEEHGVTRIQVLPSGRILTGSVDGSLRVWDERSGECTRKIKAHKDVILDMILAGNVVISTSDDKLCRVFPIESN